MRLVSVQGCDVPASDANANADANFGFTITAELRTTLQTVPYAVSGQSLGGGLALLVGRR
jgi:hypothetical protein